MGNSFEPRQNILVYIRRILTIFLILSAFTRLSPELFHAPRYHVHVALRFQFSSPFLQYRWRLSLQLKQFGDANYANEPWRRKNQSIYLPSALSSLRLLTDTKMTKSVTMCFVMLV